MLISKGASTDLLNNAKCTALYVAVSQGFTEVVRTLCELNCDVNLPVSSGVWGLGDVLVAFLGFGVGLFWCWFFFEVKEAFLYALHHLLLHRIWRSFS